MGPYDQSSRRSLPPLQRQITDLSVRVDRNRKDFDELVESAKKFQEELEVTWKKILEKFMSIRLDMMGLKDRIVFLEEREKEE